MTATVCAWCTTHSNMTAISAPRPGPVSRGEALKWVQAGFACNHCRKISVGSTVIPANELVPQTSLSPEWWQNKTVRWTPEHVGGRDFPDVPHHIGSAADEAFRCRSIGAQRASILMARSVVEATCKDNGVTKGQLAAKIDAMALQGLIRPFTQDAAHELRFLGNDMAHGDFVDAVDEDDADAVLEVMAEILNEVYQGPARVSRMKSKRAATKTSVGQP